VGDSSEICSESQYMDEINEDKTAELHTRKKLLEEKSRYLGYCVARHQELLQ
jgi:hypothetical protein